MPKLRSDFKRHFLTASSAVSELRMITPYISQSLSRRCVPNSFAFPVLKHSRLADFVASPRQRLRKAKSDDVAFSIPPNSLFTL
jgi:hypothetical protein